MHTSKSVSRWSPKPHRDMTSSVADAAEASSRWSERDLEGCRLRPLTWCMSSHMHYVCRPPWSRPRQCGSGPAPRLRRPRQCWINLVPLHRIGSLANGRKARPRSKLPLLSSQQRRTERIPSCLTKPSEASRDVQHKSTNAVHVVFDRKCCWFTTVLAVAIAKQLDDFRA